VKVSLPSGSCCRILLNNDLRQKIDPMDDTSEICLPPAASDLLESMRALGYSFEAAVADLIDNSLSAQSSSIDIRLSPFDKPHVAILDDGTGMSPSALTAAMRHGSQNPSKIRDEHDLGRFGLGLKTASLSQCRQMTVVSLSDGMLSGRCWDLDHVAARQDWMLIQLSDRDIESLPCIEQLRLQGRGTLVIWQNFDRLGAGEQSIERAFGNRMDFLREHLALVFHRVLTSTPGSPAVTITINKNPVHPFDPFLTRHKATQILPPQDFPLAGERVHVQPYILPHISKLSSDDLKLAGGEDGLRRNQGFYVYRNRRLISWGSWFRLVRQEELTKLARVQVDLSNQLDDLWKLDITKSTTYPPEALREGLRQIIGRITDGSRNVFVFRGKKASSDKIIHAWDRSIVRDGVSYRINREHPLLLALATETSAETQKLLNDALDLLEQTIPMDAIYLDMASHTRPTVPDELGDVGVSKLTALAIQILAAIGRNTDAGESFLNTLHTIEPFSFHPNIAKEIAVRLRDA
jgi:hypothetical protein